MTNLQRKIKSNCGFIATKDVADRQEYDEILSAVQDGSLIRIRSGVYSTVDAMLSNMVDIERIIPGGILCLYSAWSHYGLSTIIPPGFCVAIEHKRKVVIQEDAQITLYYWQEKNLEFGITDVEVSGFKVKMTDRERSVCDAIKYRNKIGMDVCQEVLRNYLAMPDRNISLLYEYANRLRVKNILQKYLEIQL